MQKRLAWLETNGYFNDNQISYTRTTRFLMPLIGVSEGSIKYIHPKLLINSHVKNTEEYLVFIIINKLDYPEIANEYVIIQNLNENYVDHIEEEEEYIIIYKVPEHFNDDYNKILEGKYSKTSNKYKEIITRVYSNRSNKEDHLPSVYDCLNPTDEKRKQYAKYLLMDSDWKIFEEVSSKPNLDYEIYKPINELNNG